VGIGLLKEGDDAFLVQSSEFRGTQHAEHSTNILNGLLCVSIYIDANEPKKLQYFSKFQ
jgi:hypothetical protein